MKISKTLSEIIPEWVDMPDSGLVVSEISQDSREVGSGTLFIARSGLKHRGVDFVIGAVSKGAVAIVLDASEKSLCPAVDVPVILVPDLVNNLGLIAARFYGHPSQQLTVIGVTGTNGKTSCAHFIAQAMNHLAVRTAVIGTIGNGFPEELYQATHTTPDAIGLQRLFADLKAQGAAAIVMEVSSHALEQGRVAEVDFDYALFTNLSRDHLDYHGSMSAYGHAKKRLFTDYELKAAVINGDDEFGRSMLIDNAIRCRKVSVGRTQGDYLLAAYRMALSGMDVELKANQGNLAFGCEVVGEFNLDNLLLVTALLVEQGFSSEQVKNGLTCLQSVPGRMQAVVVAEKPLVIIDYAHTPDALEKALLAVRAHTSGDLWCVFGCGGDRDIGKRALMGAVAERLADQIVVTSDNPRSEEPESIIQMILEGCKESLPVVLPDREEAIRFSLNKAEVGDVVLIAGKGHEDYQEVDGVRTPFSDLLLSRAILEGAA